MTSPSITSTSGTTSRCTPFCKVDWSREDEVKGRTDNQCSAQPWTRWTFNFINKKLSTIWKNPRIAPYKHIWKRHDNTVFWCYLKTAQRKGLRFYQTRSHAITLSDTLPAMWFAWKLVRNSTAKCISHRRLPRVTLVPNLQHVQKDVHIPMPQAMKRRPQLTKTVRSRRILDLCHLDNRFQKYKGRLVRHGAVVTGGSGSYPVFTEQGSSTSHKAAAKVVDVFARLPTCAG